MLTFAEVASQHADNINIVVNKFVEKDGSITLSAHSLDITSHGDNFSPAKAPTTPIIIRSEPHG